MITGTDLSPVQPTTVPANVYFFVDDATEDEWMWEPNTFDYIRLNNMSGSFPSIKDIMRKALRYLKPGGYIEWHEIDLKCRCDDDTMPPENPDGFSEYAVHDWVDLQERAAEDGNRQFRIAHRLADSLRQVGYVAVEDLIVKVPLNTWPRDPRLKTIGSWHEANWLDGLAGFSYKPLMGLGWSKPEIEVFLVSVRKCISNRRYHVYHNFHRVIGRKPYPDEERS
jgi:hypothetical protein